MQLDKQASYLVIRLVNREGFHEIAFIHDCLMIDEYLFETRTDWHASLAYCREVYFSNLFSIHLSHRSNTLQSFPLALDPKNQYLLYGYAKMITWSHAKLIWIQCTFRSSSCDIPINMSHIAHIPYARKYWEIGNSDNGRGDNRTCLVPCLVYA